MPEPERRSALSRNMASDKDRKEIPERCPELTDEVEHSAIPVLDQQVGADVLDATIPLLEETFSLFEKNIPVLDEAAAPAGPIADSAGEAE